MGSVLRKESKMKLLLLLAIFFAALALSSGSPGKPLLPISMKKKKIIRQRQPGRPTTTNPPPNNTGTGTVAAAEVTTENGWVDGAYITGYEPVSSDGQDDCAKKCSDLGKGCVAWSLEKSTNNCWLYSTNDEVIDDDYWVSGGSSIEKCCDSNGTNCCACKCPCPCHIDPNLNLEPQLELGN